MVSGGRSTPAHQAHGGDGGSSPEGGGVGLSRPILERAEADACGIRDATWRHGWSGSFSCVRRKDRPHQKGSKGPAGRKVGLAELGQN